MKPLCPVPRSPQIRSAQEMSLIRLYACTQIALFTVPAIPQKRASILPVTGTFVGYIIRLLRSPHVPQLSDVLQAYRAHHAHSVHAVMYQPRRAVHYHSHCPRLLIRWTDITRRAAETGVLLQLYPPRWASCWSFILRDGRPCPVGAASLAAIKRSWRPRILTAVCPVVVYRILSACGCALCTELLCTVLCPRV